MKNKCAHPGCEELKPRSQYACPIHWFTLPKRIQNSILSGYRTSASAWLAADAEAQKFWKDEQAALKEDADREMGLDRPWKEGR